MKKFAVILSGCGVFDGSEIHEATLSLLAIINNGGTYKIFAPDIPQHHVINHITGEEMNETRNVLIESARIARGNIQALSAFSASEFDGLLFPGGFGAAKNLSDWAFHGADSSVLPGVSKAINDMVSAGKPVGALCISPVLLAKTIKGAELTIGDDKDTTAALESAGANHIKTSHGEVVIDKRYNLVTSPCYMLDANIQQIAKGASNVVKTMAELMQ